MNDYGAVFSLLLHCMWKKHSRIRLHAYHAVTETVFSRKKTWLNHGQCHILSQVYKFTQKNEHDHGMNDYGMVFSLLHCFLNKHCMLITLLPRQYFHRRKLGWIIGNGTSCPEFTNSHEKMNTIMEWMIMAWYFLRCAICGINNTIWKGIFSHDDADENLSDKTTQLFMRKSLSPPPHCPFFWTQRWGPRQCRSLFETLRNTRRTSRKYDHEAKDCGTKSSFSPCRS